MRYTAGSQHATPSSSTRIDQRGRGTAARACHHAQTTTTLEFKRRPPERFSAEAAAWTTGNVLTSGLYNLLRCLSHAAAEPREERPAPKESGPDLARQSAGGKPPVPWRSPCWLGSHAAQAAAAFHPVWCHDATGCIAKCCQGHRQM